MLAFLQLHCVANLKCTPKHLLLYQNNKAGKIVKGGGLGVRGLGGLEVYRFRGLNFIPNDNALII